ncbi:hypothetical protein BDN67DRAFT_641510 [Paxillus ammoniavirescens]|nr:hypothetical protein BDN67DRAFT_641510 [Paxillus ammoniavirescens]
MYPAFTAKRQFFKVMIILHSPTTAAEASPKAPQPTIVTSLTLPFHYQLTPSYQGPLAPTRRPAQVPLIQDRCDGSFALSGMVHMGGKSLRANTVTNHSPPFSAPTSLSPAERYGRQQPFFCPTTREPRHPSDSIPSGPSPQLRLDLTTSPSGHDLGLPQLEPLRPSHAVHQGVHRGAVNATLHPTRSMARSPHNSYPYPNMQRPLHGNSSETNHHQCGWRKDDGSMCGGNITRATVPHHLVQHGITALGSDAAVECRWCPDGTKPIKRKSIVRHVREAHLRISRMPTSRAGASGLGVLHVFFKDRLHL